MFINLLRFREGLFILQFFVKLIDFILIILIISVNNAWQNYFNFFLHIIVFNLFITFLIFCMVLSLFVMSSVSVLITIMFSFFRQLFLLTKNVFNCCSMMVSNFDWTGWWEFIYFIMEPQMIGVTFLGGF